MMAHIRYATQGSVCLENVHPFSRELWGIQWTFAHNGECPKFTNVTYHENTPLLGSTTAADLIYNPIGDTDSEAAFCAILNALRAEFPEGLPTLPVLHEFLKMICDEIIADRHDDTIFNFLLGCGQYTLFAYSWPGSRPGSSVWNGLHYLIREPPFSTASLLDVDYTIDFRTVTTPVDRVAVITTKPLTREEGWCEMRRGELIMFDQGRPYHTPQCCARVEQEGRGLSSKRFTNKAKCHRSPSFTPTRNPPPCMPPPLSLSEVGDGKGRMITCSSNNSDSSSSSNSSVAESVHGASVHWQSFRDSERTGNGNTSLVANALLAASLLPQSNEASIPLDVLVIAEPPSPVRLSMA
jgi:predicted glutamine amidotransferase